MKIQSCIVYLKIIVVIISLFLLYKTSFKHYEQYHRKDSDIVFRVHPKELKTIDFLNSTDWGEGNIRFWTGGGGYIYDLSQQRAVAPSLLPQKIAFVEKFDLEDLDVVITHEDNDFQFEYLCQHSPHFKEFTLKNSKGYLICKRKSYELTGRVVSEEEPEESNLFLFSLVLSSLILLVMLYMGRQFWFPSKVDRLLVPLTGVAIVLTMCYLTNNTYISNRAESGIWFYKSKILYEEGVTGYYNLSFSENGAKHAPSYPIGAHVLHVLTAKINGSFHPYIPRVTAILGMILLFGISPFLLGNSLGYYLGLFCLCSPNLLLTCFWGLSEIYCLLSCLLVLFFLYKYRIHNGKIALLFLTVSAVAASLFKQESGLFVLFALGILVFCRIPLKHRIYLLFCIMMCMSWYVLAKIYNLPSDFNFKVDLINQENLKIFKFALSALLDLFEFSVDNILYFGVLLLALIALYYRKEYCTGELLTITLSCLLYVAFFLTIFIFSKLSTMEDIRDWHISVMGRIMLLPTIMFYYCVAMKIKKLSIFYFKGTAEKL